MPISRELLTAQAVAREPLSDAPGWADAFSAGAARALEVLTDGGHLIPDPLEREQLEAMSDEEIHAHLTVHRQARYKAGSPDGPAAAVLLRRVIQRDQPEATMLVRDMDDDERYELTDAEDKTLAPATAAVAAALGSTRSTSPARSSPGATTLPTSTSPDRGRSHCPARRAEHHHAMAIDPHVLTARALAREPRQDSPGWQEAFTAGVTRALEVLLDDVHVVPDTLTPAQAPGRRCGRRGRNDRSGWHRSRHRVAPLRRCGDR
jgi:hypothetical protein